MNTSVLTPSQAGSSNSTLTIGTMSPVNATPEAGLRSNSQDLWIGVSRDLLIAS